MIAPVGAVVKLYIDARQQLMEADVVQTQTGRSYRVITVRRQTRGMHVGRQHFTAVVIPAEQVTDDDTVMQIRWYRR